MTRAMAECEKKLTAQCCGHHENSDRCPSPAHSNVSNRSGLSPADVSRVQEAMLFQNKRISELEAKLKDAEARRDEAVAMLHQTTSALGKVSDLCVQNRPAISAAQNMCRPMYQAPHQQPIPAASVATVHGNICYTPAMTSQPPSQGVVRPAAVGQPVIPPSPGQAGSTSPPTRRYF
eukprot:7061931-Prymnesium_polylepis.1